LVINFEEDNPSTTGRAVLPRGHRSNKQDLKNDSQARALQETLQGIIAEKEEVRGMEATPREKGLNDKLFLTSTRERLKMKRSIPVQEPWR
jgi:hypothetical protein